MFDVFLVPGWPRKIGLALAAVATASTIAAVVFFQTRGDETESATPAASPQSATKTEVFGPGQISRSGTWHRMPPTASDPEQPLSADERGQLVINNGLLEAFNYYLLEQAGEGDEDELKAYLKSKLPEQADNEALQLLDRYKTYMKEHDDYLAAQGLSVQPGATPDLKRIKEWVIQRSRLRQGSIGPIAAQAWYENDDAQLRQALDEVQQRGLDPSTPPSTEPGHPVPHWQSADEENQHIKYQLGLLAKATTSYTSLKHQVQ